MLVAGGVAPKDDSAAVPLAIGLDYLLDQF